MRRFPAALELANADLSTVGGFRRWLSSAETSSEGIDRATLRLADFAEVRAAIVDLIDASIGGDPFPVAAVRRLNEASERVPRVLRLAEDGSTDESELTASATASLLGVVARSGIRLLGGSDRERLRRCPACGRYFLSSRVDRRWCSAACGNRARVARHYRRRREAGSAGSSR